MNARIEELARAMCKAGGEDPDSLVSLGDWPDLTAAPYPRWRGYIEAAEEELKRRHTREPAAGPQDDVDEALR